MMTFWGQWQLTHIKHQKFTLTIGLQFHFGSVPNCLARRIFVSELSLIIIPNFACTMLYGVRELKMGHC
jgi:hypothetical protein